MVKWPKNGPMGSDPMARLRGATPYLSYLDLIYKIRIGFSIFFHLPYGIILKRSTFDIPKIN